MGKEAMLFPLQKTNKKDDEPLCEKYGEDTYQLNELFAYPFEVENPEQITALN